SSPTPTPFPYTTLFRSIGDQSYSQRLQRIRYDHIPEIAIHTPAHALFVPLRINFNPGLNILYIPGSGDEISECLRNLGYDRVDRSEEHTSELQSRENLV